MAIVMLNRWTLQPGCVLIQAAMGGDHGFVTEHFPGEHWTLSPEDLVPVEIDPEIAARIVRHLNATGGAPAKTPLVGADRVG